nr:uncharacterized protein LOC114819848 [Malus domestica]
MSGVSSENEDKDEDVDRDGEHDVICIESLIYQRSLIGQLKQMAFAGLISLQIGLLCILENIFHYICKFPLGCSPYGINKAKFNKLSSLTSRESSFGALVQKLVLVINIFKL